MKHKKKRPPRSLITSIAPLPHLLEEKLLKRLQQRLKEDQKKTPYNIDTNTPKE